MAWAVPPHPCGTPRCPGLAPRGKRYCSSCEPKAVEKQQRQELEARGNAGERDYGAPWRAIRETILERDHHLCRYCAQVKRMTQGNIVDHIRSRAAKGTDDDTNLVTCCADCHNEKSQLHDGWGGRPLNPIDRIEQFVPTWHERRAPIRHRGGLFRSSRATSRDRRPSFRTRQQIKARPDLRSVAIASWTW